ncbi:MAG: hypothetical protein JKY50_00680 [Oleispira sp.]|nr:hypothetical protein [Oleispira sp.]
MSKIKLVPVPNIKTHEVLTRMMENGETFKYIKPSPEGAFVTNIVHDLHYDRSHPVNPFRLGTNAWNFRGLKYLHEEIEQKWYEDPDMIGKPVKVRDSEFDSWIFTSFVKLNNNEPLFKFTCIDDEWQYAEPLTAADLYQEQV